MKIRDGFALREINGQGIVVATGKRALTFNGMIRLNEVGTLVWKLLEEGIQEKEILQKVTSVYDVAENTAAEDIKELLEKLLNAGILDE